MKKTRRSLLAFLAIAFVIVLALACTLGFAACGDDNGTVEDCGDGNHTVTTWDSTTAATCTEDGSRTGKCDVCGKTVTEKYGDALGHTSDGGKVTKNATASENGVITESCSVCGTVLGTSEFTNAYLSNFVTGAYVTGTSVEDYYKYANPDDSTITATFTDSVVTSVEFDGTQFIVSGTSYKMSEDQLKAYWGSTNYSNYAGDEYIVVTIAAKTGEQVSIKTSKGNEYTLNGDAVKQDGTTPDVDATFFSSVVDVDNFNSDRYLFSVIDGQNEYKVVVGDIAKTGYVANFVTGEYVAVSDGGTIPEDAYKYTNSEENTSATFTDSVVTSVEFDGEKYIVNGDAAFMTDEQLKVFWGTEGSANHTWAQYLVVSVMPIFDGEAFTIVSTKSPSPDGVAIGGTSGNDGYSLFFDVTDAEAGAWLFTIVDADGNEYDVVLGDVTLAKLEPIAVLYTDGFSMTYGSIGEVEASDVSLYLYENGTADLYLTINIGITMSLPFTGLEYTIDATTKAIELVISSLGNAEGTVSYDNDGAIASITFTTFAGTEQSIVFTTAAASEGTETPVNPE